MTDHALSVITACATLLAALAAVAGVWIAGRGISRQNAQADASRKDFKLSLSADLSMKLDDRFNTREFRQVRSDAARALLSNQKLVDAEDVFDFFETVGLLVRTEALTKELAYNFFFHWINIYWLAGQAHIQKKQRATRSLWKNFEYLYSTVLEIERATDAESADLKLAKHPSQLKKLLAEEVIKETHQSVLPQ